MLKSCGRICVAVIRRNFCNEAKRVQMNALNENCILVSPDDEIIGKASKKDCHLVPKEGKIPLHRAFSVFLFNNEKQLLLQQRSEAKITYPLHYTNSCCSHPIADIPGEDDEECARGVLRAAQRRLCFELGIKIDAIPIESLKYITRVHYYDKGDGLWGEHEIDYIIFLKANLEIEPNPHEISEISFVPRDSIDSHIKTLTPLTPWFSMIYKRKLKEWWDNLDNIEKITDHKNILRF